MILIPGKSGFVLTPLCYVLRRHAANTNLVFGLTRADIGHSKYRIRYMLKNLLKSTPFLFHFIVRIFLVLTYLNQEIRDTWLPDDKSPIVFLNFRIFCNKYIDLRNELIFTIAYPLACEFSLLLFRSDTISIDHNIDICLKVL